MLILSDNKIDRMDFEEATHRFHELEALLVDCQGVPEDSKIMKEYLMLKKLLEAPIGQ